MRSARAASRCCQTELQLLIADSNTRIETVSQKSREKLCLCGGRLQLQAIVERPQGVHSVV
jgi:hypothetical protein